MKTPLSYLPNCEASTIRLCRILQVPVTTSSLKKSLEMHPDYPSLLAVSDVLHNYGINNMSVRVKAIQLSRFPVPLLAQIKTSAEDRFAVIEAATEEAVEYIHPVSHQRVKTAIHDFSKVFTGIVMLVETTETSGEKDYKAERTKERKSIFFQFLAAMAVPFITLLTCTTAFMRAGASALPAIMYTLLTLAGTVTAALLIWYEADLHNPVLQKICTAGKKANCSAVLQSKASGIFGISWSVAGFVYFSGSLICQLFYHIYYFPSLLVLSWLTIAALPYIVFSLYYQARVVKQWCVLCLAVQAILAMQFITVLSGKLYMLSTVSTLGFADAMSIFVAFLLPFLVLSLLLPALKGAKENRSNKIRLQRLKHNVQIFEALLIRQKTITEAANGLGITLGNAAATYKLTKVCSPYCGPCALAHPEIEHLLHNNPDIQLQIIFTASGRDNDRNTPPVAQLLAIAESNDEIAIRQALDDWYLAPQKNYETFAATHPVDDTAKNQVEKMKSMHDWCNKMDIAFTPTFFVNGYQLPDMYDVADLKYFLSV